MAGIDWQDRAACRDENPELFFPTGDTGPALLQIEQAKAVCNRCPVMGQCRQWALETRQDSGVWGGLSEGERRATQRRQTRSTATTPPQPRPVAKCGTRSGYKRHQREHSAICSPCRAANTAYVIKLDRRKRSAEKAAA